MSGNGPDLWALYLAVFSSALAVVLLATPWAHVRGPSQGLGVLDVPNARKVHLQPTPLLGGVAIYAAIWIALLLISRLELAQQYVFLPDTTGELALIFLSTVVLILVGILDDRATGGIPPWAKLLGQLLAAAIVLAAGVRFQVFGLLPLDLVLTLVWLVGISNAVNFLDNIDGLSAGATAIAAAFFFILASANGQYLVAIMALAVAGGCLGFLRYNFNPAVIFMGDAGTLFLGFLLAIIGAKLQLGPTGWWGLIAAVLILILPIFDTTFVTLNRLRTRRRVTQGGQGPHQSSASTPRPAPQAGGPRALYGGAGRGRRGPGPGPGLGWLGPGKSAGLTGGPHPPEGRCRCSRPTRGPEPFPACTRP